MKNATRRAGLWLSASALAFIVACGGGDSGGTTNNNTPADPTTVTNAGVVTGRIQSDSGTALGGVTVGVAANGATRQAGTTPSNEQGFFVLTGVTPGTDLVLTCTLTGYTNAVRLVDVSDGEQTHVDDIVMTAIGNEQPLDNATGGTVADNRADGMNGSITIPAGGVVNSRGRQVTGSYNVRVTTLTPSDTNFTAQFPGAFEGTPTGGENGPIVSFGVVDAEVRDAAGNLLQLDANNPSEITFPFDNDPGTPTVPLWYLNTTTGRWVQQGVATRDTSVTPNVWRATVTHLTPWNCDEPLSNASFKEVHVVDADGDPVRNARVLIEGTNWRQRRSTNSDGIATIRVEPSAQITVTVSKGTLSVTRTETSGAAGTTVRNDFVLAPPVATVMLTWGATPRDLDSHMTGPDPVTAGNRFHVYYASKGSLTASPFCNLDTDDVSSYGPEIVTVTRVTEGVYRYSIHNYSGQTNGPIESSGCRVTLVAPGTQRVFTVPTSNPNNDNVWRVFELNFDANNDFTGVTVLNDFVSASASTVTRSLEPK